MGIVSENTKIKIATENCEEYRCMCGEIMSVDFNGSYYCRNPWCGACPNPEKYLLKK